MCFKTKARWYPWNTLNLMSLTSWCCANALWILNYSTQFYACNKSSIKTCKDFGIKKFSFFFGSVTRNNSFFNFFFFLLILSCGFLSHVVFQFLMNKTKKKNVTKVFWCCICVWESFEQFLWLPFYPGFLLDCEAQDFTTRKKLKTMNGNCT